MSAAPLTEEERRIRRAATTRRYRVRHPLTAEQKAAAAARKRTRYAADPEYRARVSAGARLSRERNRERHIAYHRAYYQEHRLAIIAAQRTYYEAHRDEYRSKDVARTYGVEPDWYLKQLEAQGGLCAICRKPETKVIAGRRLTLAVDHDHSCCGGKTSCGKCVRKLLCATCNLALGYFSHDADLLRHAALYLEAFA